MKPPIKATRCLIYTRKSCSEGLEQEFNSLDAQYESCAAYAKSQAGDGWIVLPEKFDDGGFSGGDMERPALQRLLSHVRSGKVDVVLVYKIDRLSRSLLDFAEIAKLFEAHGVSFVSVTQRIDTSTSAGRLMLNVLLSFAQFEREIVSERTRDKIAMARRKGKWSGGRPPLGYDADRIAKKLVVNPAEADRVRELFQLYIEHEALLPVVREATRRGWTTKTGREFDKAYLYNLLTNVLCAGLVRHHDQTYPGEHEATVSEKTFRRVQDILKRNGANGGAAVRNKHGALLKGLLHCACCQCSMGHSYSSKGRVRYRYYLCLNASKKGWKACPAPSVPAGEIEAFVVDRIRGVAKDPRLIAETVRQTRAESQSMIRALQDERAALRKSRSNPERVLDLDQQIESLRCALVTEADVVAAFARFDELWATLSPHEQGQIVNALVKRVEWDGRAEQLRITFHPTGLRGLVEQSRPAKHEEAA